MGNKTMQAFNQSRGRMLIENGLVAARPWARLRGLIGRPALQSGEGLLLPATKGIHTIGMCYAIDIAFLNKQGCVIHLIHSMHPFRISRVVGDSAMALELPAGILRETGTAIGDLIEVSLVDGAERQSEHSSATGIGAR